MPGGAIPDAGATIEALEHITDRKVELVAGKPSALMMKVAIAAHGAAALAVHDDRRSPGNGYSHVARSRNVHRRHSDRVTKRADIEKMSWPPSL